MGIWCATKISAITSSATYFACPLAILNATVSYASFVMTSKFKTTGIFMIAISFIRYINYIIVTIFIDTSVINTITYIQTKYSTHYNRSQNEPSIKFNFLLEK